MTRYLIYDAACPICIELAEAIVDSSKAGIQAVDIHNDQARELLNRAYPNGWDYSPYLVSTKQESVKAWTGLSAAVRLALLLGPRRSWQFWILARQYGLFLPAGRRVGSYNTARRRFLKTASGAALGTLIARILGYNIFETRLVFASGCDSCFSGCMLLGSYQGCDCLEPQCGHCSPGCNPDAYKTYICNCSGNIHYCMQYSCNGCGCA